MKVSERCSSVFEGLMHLLVVTDDKEKEEEQQFKETYKPLIDYLKNELSAGVSEGELTSVQNQSKVSE